ncbi:MAG: translation initiation factor [Muribaculaceae bacterium]|nr:translation initiation factor [Muribaculaceae bacterium]
MAQDWKDALASLRGEMPAADAACLSAPDNGAASADPSSGDGAAVSGGAGRRLRIFYEKKGRAGKPATIIDGFDPDDDTEALATARMLKQRIGCGGSARGGEILLQGDRREQARKLLTGLGYRL